jgi:putative transposase
VPDLPYHITHRGNRREDVFFCPEDREIYRQWLGHYTQVYGMEIWAYCFMTNHVHFVAIARRQDSLSKAIGRTHMRYARWINRQRGWSGHLWANRFASTPLDEKHLWTAIKYVELNPVRAGMVKQAEEYEFSSARAHVLGREDTLLSQSSPVPGPISNWGHWLSEGLEEQVRQQIHHHTNTGRPCGTREFVESLESRLERPLKPMKRGRKRKDDRRN